MANTTNFGWETPDDTDLVKDGAAAMRTLGSAIDTSMMDLKGGTTGQNLRKNSNTDMDFTWAGDATNTVIDAEGDLLVGDSADTLQRLAIGTTGQVLTVDTTIDGKIKWAAAAGGGKVLQVVQTTYSTPTTSTSTSYADTGLSLAITPSSTSSKVLVLVQQSLGMSRSSFYMGAGFQLLRGSTTIFSPSGAGAFAQSYVDNGNTTQTYLYLCHPMIYLDSPSTTSSTTYKTQHACNVTSNSGTVIAQVNNCISSLTLIEIGA